MGAHHISSATECCSVVIFTQKTILVTVVKIAIFVVVYGCKNSNLDCCLFCLCSKKSNRSETLHSLDVSVEEQVWLLKGLLHTPHPLVDSGHHTLWEFHHQFAAYCANYGFVVPLWKYCSMHGLVFHGL